MVTVTLRFYEELNDRLAPALRRREFERACPPGATARQVIEAFGIGLDEIELILVDGESAAFDRVLREGDRIAVYPVFEAFDVTPLLCVREAPLRVTRFMTSGQLGALARLLRMAGFDTLCGAHLSSSAIAGIAARERRIVLARERALLARADVTRGFLLHSETAVLQLREIVERLDLKRSVRPFTRCIHCNAALRGIDDRSCVRQRVPASVYGRYAHFSICDVCGRVFWPGRHWNAIAACLADTELA
jgi:uncharacterized protein